MYLMSQAPDPAMRVAGRAASFRIESNAQGATARRYLTTQDGGYDPAPTKRQIAAVLVALSEMTLSQHLLGPDVLALGTPKNEDFGDRFKQANGIGRFLYAVADQLAAEAAAEEKAHGYR